MNATFVYLDRDGSPKAVPAQLQDHNSPDAHEEFEARLRDTFTVAEGESLLVLTTDRENAIGQLEEHMEKALERAREAQKAASQPAQQHHASAPTMVQAA